jgi:hypothetical protein
MTSLEYQRDIATEFSKRGDKISPIAIERWRQRGAVQTGRLLLLLKIAEERGMKINLLDFAISDEEFQPFKAADKAMKEKRKAKLQALLRRLPRSVRESA